MLVYYSVAATGGTQIGYNLFMVGHAKIESLPMPNFRWGTGPTWPHPPAASGTST